MKVAAGFFEERRVRAALGFGLRAGKTRLIAQRTPHPFHITRPFHHPGEPGGMATLYLQSSAGGLYGDDALDLDVTLEPGAAVHLTTQASTVVHDARGRAGSVQQTVLDVGAGAVLEFLPDPTILMAGARLKTHIQARLAPGARLIMADAQMSHDPAAQGRPFAQALNDVQILRAGALLLRDRFDVSGQDWAGRLGGFACTGTVLVAGGHEAGPAMLEAASAVAGVYAGLSSMPDRDIALVRFLAADGVALSKAMNACWASARLAHTGLAPPPRRK